MVCNACNDKHISWVRIINAIDPFSANPPKWCLVSVWCTGPQYTKYILHVVDVFFAFVCNNASSAASKLHNYAITICSQKFREINLFSKRYYTVNWFHVIFLKWVRVNFCVFHTVIPKVWCVILYFWYTYKLLPSVF